MNRFKKIFSHELSLFGLLEREPRHYPYIIVVICLLAIFFNVSIKAFAAIPSDIVAKSIDSHQMIKMSIEDNGFSQNVRLNEVKDSIGKGTPENIAVFSKFDKPLNSKSSKDDNKSSDYRHRPSWVNYIYAALLGFIPAVFLCSIPILNDLMKSDRKT